MIYILNIGYTSYAFATSRGLQTVMDAMAKARELKHHYYHGCETNSERMDLREEPVEMSMHCVQGVSFVSGKSKSNVIEPEVMPKENPGTCIIPRGRTWGTPAALSKGGKSAVAFELRRMLGEGK